MVRYTKKEGKIIKNNSYKYGYLGEKFIKKNIKCPRCKCKLDNLKANNPGTDFKCKNNHYFQLKSKNKKSLNLKAKNWKLMCGSYSHQKEAILYPNNTDFLLLSYDKNAHSVNKLFWLKNEKIRRPHLQPRFVKRYKNKEDKEGYDYECSTLNCCPEDFEEIPFRQKNLDNDFKKNPSEKIAPMKDIIIDVFDNDKKHQVNLTDINSSKGSKNWKHIFSALEKWKGNKRSRCFVESNKNIYCVDTDNLYCSCLNFKFRHVVCKHLRKCTQNEDDKDIIVHSNINSLKKLIIK